MHSSKAAVDTELGKNQTIGQQLALKSTFLDASAQRLGGTLHVAEKVSWELDETRSRGDEL